MIKETLLLFNILALNSPTPLDIKIDTVEVKQTESINAFLFYTRNFYYYNVIINFEINYTIDNNNLIYLDNIIYSAELVQYNRVYNEPWYSLEFEGSWILQPKTTYLINNYYTYQNAPKIKLNSYWNNSRESITNISIDNTLIFNLANLSSYAETLAGDTSLSIANTYEFNNTNIELRYIEYDNIINNTYDSAYNDIFNAGKDAGYSEGYEQGEKGAWSFEWLRQLFDSLASIFNYELLPGFKLIYIFIAPILISFVYMILKLFR